MPDFPAHASPAITPLASPHPQYRNRAVSDLRFGDQEGNGSSLPSLVSPAYTPPQTPFQDAQRRDRQPRSVPVEPRTDGGQDEEAPRLLETLPTVSCEVRARIPTTTGQEMWLHVYHNDSDEKEHLAIVFGPYIRSKTLDAQRPDDTEMKRMIRGAYVGTLYPGRTSSRIEQIRKEAGVASTPSASPRDVPSSPALSASDSSSEFETSYPLELGPPLVRIHSECYTGETVWSARCDCGEQLDEAARLMSLPAQTPTATPTREHPPPPNMPSAGGVIVYLRQEGRGIGLLSKLKAYNLQDLGHDTMEANLLLRHPGDARSYGIATAILLDLGLGGQRGITLLTNNPEKVRAVEGPNQEVRVVRRMPMIPLAWQTGGQKGVHGPEVEKYISTKIEKFKHMFLES